MLTEDCSSVEFSPTTGLPNDPAVIVSPSDVSEGIQNLSIASEEPLSLVASTNPVSYLWTSLSQADISEHQESSLTLSELEAIYGIPPRNISSTSNRDKSSECKNSVLVVLAFCQNCIAEFLLGGFFFCDSF